MSALSLAADLVGGPPTQDWIELAGHRSPGLAVVRAAGTPRTWDIRQAYGFTGAVVTFTGAGLAKFEVDIYAWLPAHFSAWKTFAKATLAAPAPVRNPASLAIRHPVLTDPPLAIEQVVVEDVSQWEQNEDGGLWVRTIKFIQYKRPLPVLVTPLQGPPGAPIAVKPDPELAQIAENAKRIAELAK